jgi:hypothetical protein
VTELKGFLGLIGYYRRFVKGYGILAKPLTQLLKKKQFLWDSTIDSAFQNLKHAMTTTLVLVLSVAEDATKSRYCRDNELKKCMPQFKRFSQQANVK